MGSRWPAARKSIATICKCCRTVLQGGRRPVQHRSPRAHRTPSETCFRRLSQRHRPQRPSAHMERSDSLPWQEEERACSIADPDTRRLTDPCRAARIRVPKEACDSQQLLMLWDYKTRSMDPVFPPPLDEQYPEVVLRGLSAMLPGLSAYFGRATRPRRRRRLLR